MAQQGDFGVLLVGLWLRSESFLVCFWSAESDDWAVYVILIYFSSFFCQDADISENQQNCQLLDQEGSVYLPILFVSIFFSNFTKQIPDQDNLALWKFCEKLFFYPGSEERRRGRFGIALSKIFHLLFQKRFSCTESFLIALLRKNIFTLSRMLFESLNLFHILEVFKAHFGCDRAFFLFLFQKRLQWT